MRSIRITWEAVFLEFEHKYPEHFMHCLTSPRNGAKVGGLQRQRIRSNCHRSVQSQSLPSLATACRRFHSHRQKQHQLQGKRTTSKENTPTKKTVHADIPAQALKKLLKSEKDSPLQLGCYQYGFFVIGSKQDSAKIEAQAVHHADSLVMADDGQRWAAVKAFTLCGGRRLGV